MNRIKVAHILHSVGGVDVSLRLILENIDSVKFENIVVHGINDTKEKYTNKLNNKVKEYTLPIQRNINILKDIIAIYKTAKILKKEKPDIIHAHSAKGGIVAKIVGKFLGIPVLHTPQAYSFLSTSNNFKRSLYLFIEKIFLFKGNKILASSNSEKNRAIREVGYPEERVVLFNNSIAPISKLNKLNIEKNWPNEYICSVGRPSFQKNIELMLDVLFEIKTNKPSIHLVLMGVGYHAPNLESVNAKIEALQLKENITLLEWTSREDIFNIISNSQLYISTARYEGLPYSVIEALAIGKPIVVTNSDGNRDLVKHNVNGYIIDDENIEGFSKEVMNILENKDISERFSKNAIQIFEENFNMLKNIKKLEQIYFFDKYNKETDLKVVGIQEFSFKDLILNFFDSVP